MFRDYANFRKNSFTSNERYIFTLNLQWHDTEKKPYISNFFHEQETVKTESPYSLANTRDITKHKVLHNQRYQLLSRAFECFQHTFDNEYVVLTAAKSTKEKAFVNSHVKYNMSRPNTDFFHKDHNIFSALWNLTPSIKYDVYFLLTVDSAEDEFS